MKYLRVIMALALAFVLCSAFTMKKDKDKEKEKEKPVYVFGVAASFSDTVVYYTPVQLVDSVVLDKNGFLPQRDMYSYQLKNHVEYQLNKPNYTCSIYFSENKKKLEKEAAKVTDTYRKNQYGVQVIGPEDFKFEKPQE